MGQPGTIHDTLIHNRNLYPHQDTHLVGPKESLEFSNWMESGKPDLERNYPYYPMYYDKTMEFARERNFYLIMLFGFVSGLYLYKRYDIEVARQLRTERMSKLKDLPEHHFSNRGGIVTEK